PRLLLLSFPPPPSPSLFPYTTLFRSESAPWRLRAPTCPCRRARAASGSRPAATAAGAARTVRPFQLPPLRRPIAYNERGRPFPRDRKSTRLNSSHDQISYAVFCLKKK